MDPADGGVGGVIYRYNSAEKFEWKTRSQNKVQEQIKTTNTFMIQRRYHTSTDGKVIAFVR